MHRGRRQEGSIQPFTDYKLVGVNAVTANPEISARLAAFLADDYAQSVRLSSRKYAPTIESLQKAVLENEDPTKVPVDVVAATEQIGEGHCVVRPSIAQMDKYWNPAQAVGEAIVTGKTKDEKAIKCLMFYAVLAYNISIL